MKKTDVRQLELRQKTKNLGTEVQEDLRNILLKIDSEFDLPLKIHASFPDVDSKLNFSPSEVESGDGAKKTLPPLLANILDISPSSIDFQTQAVVGNFNIVFPASTVGFYRRAGFTLLADGNIEVIFSEEENDINNLPNAGTLLIKKGLPLGYIDLVCTDISGLFKTANSTLNLIENDDLYRFSLGGSGGGSDTFFEATSGENLLARIPVYISDGVLDAGRIAGRAYATNLSDDFRREFAGFTTEESLSGEEGEILTYGFLDGFTGLIPGIPIWLTPSTVGGITQLNPALGGSIAVRVGLAISPTTILVDFHQPQIDAEGQIFNSDGDASYRLKPSIRTLVLEDANNVRWKVEVDTDGVLSTTTTADEITPLFKIVKPDTTFGALVVDIDGTLGVESPPADPSVVEDNFFYIEDAQNVAWKFTLTDDPTTIVMRRHFNTFSVKSDSNFNLFVVGEYRSGKALFFLGYEDDGFQALPVDVANLYENVSPIGLVKEQDTIIPVFHDGDTWQKLSQSVNPNFYNNGNFDFWQRGTSLASGGYIADRVQGSFNFVGGVATQSRSTDVPDPSCKYSLRVTHSSANTSSFSELVTRQRYERSVMRLLANKKVVLSFWYKSSRIGEHVARVANNQGTGVVGASDIAQTFEVYEANVWEFKVIRFPVLAISSFGSSAEESFSGFCDIGPKRGLQGQVAWNNGDYYSIAKVKLEEGHIPTEFSYSGGSLDGEYDLCQRYYQKSYNLGNNPGTITTSGADSGRKPSANTTLLWSLQLPKKMRAIPSVRLYSQDTGVIDRVRDGTNNVDRAATAQFIGETGFRATLSTGISGDLLIAFHYTADAEL